MGRQFDVHTIGLIFTTLASLSIAGTALRHRERSGAQGLGLMMLSLSICSLACTFEANAVTIPPRVFWSQIAYIGTVTCPIFLLVLTAQVTSAGGHIAVSVPENSVDTRRGVAIHVQDTGPGIPDDEQPRVFERIFRGQITESGQIPGASLGLNIAQTIVTARNGRISLESSDQGTKVAVWLPSVAPGKGD